jgi:hypothetical protein
VRKAKLHKNYVKGLVVDGVVDEDVFLFVDCQEMSPMAVLDQLAVGNLDIL